MKSEEDLRLLHDLFLSCVLLREENGGPPEDVKSQLVLFAAMLAWLVEEDVPAAHKFQFFLDRVIRKAEATRSKTIHKK